VGTQRQYTGTAGRIENAQVAVYCTYATGKGRALVDREVYLPRSWADDPARRAQAGVPEQVTFATKPALARRMLTRALDAAVPAGWVTADEGYGGDRALRRLLHGRDTGYVLAVACDHHVTVNRAAGPQRVDRIVGRLPTRVWNRRSGGAGAKGERLYDWAWLPITPPDDEAGGHHWLLVRRRIHDGELAFYRCWAPQPVPLSTLVRVAATRWAVEETFQSSKATVGLDQPQVRRWDSWYRYITLAMLAHAILTAIAVREQAKPPGEPDLIPLTVAEVRRLFAKLIANPMRTIDEYLAWSRWRRRHQHRAKTSHYRRQHQQLHQCPST
jgi:SRSO17 transposase